jgi:hypothetical protein
MYEVQPHRTIYQKVLPAFFQLLSVNIIYHSKLSDKLLHLYLFCKHDYLFDISNIYIQKIGKK